MSIETRDTALRSTNGGGRRARQLLAFAPAVLAVITLAACGNSGTSTAAANPPNPAPTASAGAGPNASRQIPGVSGLVAAITGKTLQVQGTSTQTAVTYNAKTTFTATVAGSAADIKVGSCVTVSEPTSTASPSSSMGTPVTKVTAGRVSVTTAVNGSCVRAGGFGGGFGGTRPSGAPTITPTPRASDAPGAGQGNRAGGFGGFGGTIGKVTSVSGSGFVVASTGFGQAATTTTVTVTTSSTTTFTTTRTATSTAVATGTCVTAIGKADSTGALTATSISVRPAQNGACTTGARGGRPNAGTHG